MQRGRPRDKDLIPLRKAPQLVKDAIGIKRSGNAIYYWATRGIVNSHGVIVKLRTTKRIKTLYTTKEWMDEFLRDIG